MQNAGNDTALTCNIRLPIDVKMEPPIYVYYEIKGMYQNFRRCVGCKRGNVGHAKAAVAPCQGSSAGHAKTA
eukprot:91204-Chlamydomonas_euryale.AAC.1